MANDAENCPKLDLKVGLQRIRQARIFAQEAAVELEKKVDLLYGKPKVPDNLNENKVKTQTPEPAFE